MPISPAPGGAGGAIDWIWDDYTTGGAGLQRIILAREAPGPFPPRLLQPLFAAPPGGAGREGARAAGFCGLPAALPLFFMPLYFSIRWLPVDHTCCSLAAAGVFWAMTPTSLWGT